MFRLAGEMVERGQRVITTTTTRIAADQILAAPGYVSLEGNSLPIGEIKDVLDRHAHCMVIGRASAQRLEGDKKAGIEQLAQRHAWIDSDRVGIYGHSGGGFMSTAAMLVYPDFFKVAVSSSGNHDNKIYNRWWSEIHHGVDETENDEQES